MRRLLLLMALMAVGCIDAKNAHEATVGQTIKHVYVIDVPSTKCIDISPNYVADSGGWGVDMTVTDPSHCNLLALKEFR